MVSLGLVAETASLCRGLTLKQRGCAAAAWPCRRKCAEHGREGDAEEQQVEEDM